MGNLFVQCSDKDDPENSHQSEEGNKKNTLKGYRESDLRSSNRNSLKISQNPSKEFDDEDDI